MFGEERCWKNTILIEGESQANLFARMMDLGRVKPNAEYPMDIDLPGKRTFKEAVQVMIEYSKHNIYSQIWRWTKRPKDMDPGKE